MGLRVVTGALVTSDTLLGGIEAVFWTDCVQSVALGGGGTVAFVSPQIALLGTSWNCRALSEACFALGSDANSLDSIQPNN